MKLKLTLLGSRPKPARILAGLLSEIDERLFEIEGKRIIALNDAFPDLDRRSIQNSLNAYEQAYRQGMFSMLQIEAIDYGCITVTALVMGAAYCIVKSTIGKDIETVYQEMGMSKKIRGLLKKEVKRFFIDGHGDNLQQAVKDVARRRMLLPSDMPGVGMDGYGDIADFKRITRSKKDNGEVLEVQVEVVQAADRPKNYYELVQEYNSYLPEEESIDEDENEGEDNVQHVTQ